MRLLQRSSASRADATAVISTSSCAISSTCSGAAFVVLDHEQRFTCWSMKLVILVNESSSASLADRLLEIGDRARP